MSTSQEIKDAADAAISAKDAMATAQSSYNAALATAVAAAQALPEGVAFLSAAAAYDTVFNAELVNANVPSAESSYTSAREAYQLAVEALQTAIASYDGT